MATLLISNFKIKGINYKLLNKSWIKNFSNGKIHSIPEIDKMIELSNKSLRVDSIFKILYSPYNKDYKNLKILPNNYYKSINYYYKKLTLFIDLIHPFYIVYLFAIYRFLKVYLFFSVINKIIFNHY